jgi:hypothetical protein
MNILGYDDLGKLPALNGFGTLFGLQIAPTSPITRRKLTQE